MVEALIAELLGQLASISAQQAQQEIKLLVGVDDEVQNLSNNLVTIQAVLDDAEERLVKPRAEKLWLDQLKDAYYKIDDVLDEWNTARIKSEIQKEEEGDHISNAPALKKKVFSFLPSPSCCFGPTNNLALRHDIGHKIKNLNETLDKIIKGRVLSGFDLTRQPVVVERPKTTSFVEVSDIIGRDNYKDDLLSNLLGEGSSEERKHRVISLVGMGGIGKSSLAQLAYNHPEVQAHFEKMMWVCVSDPFDQCRVAKAIIQEIDPKFPNNITELQSLLRTITGLIKDKKFFLVLDDVWTEDSSKWEPFRDALKCGAQGSRILTTTRKHRVAEMLGSSHMINLGVLSPNDCWLVFSKIAFSDEGQELCKDLEDLGKQLANKCKGLPLAAKTLGSLMRNKRSREQWKNILDSSLWELEDFEKGILAPLLLSYYELPSAMRRCFSFCVVFPKDHYFRRDELVLLWMAQGYIDSQANMEMKAEEYFDVLTMRSFFQDFEKDMNDGQIVRCKMHDIVHDFAQSMTKNECFTIDSDEEFRTDLKSARHLSLTVKETFPVKVYGATNLRFLNLNFLSSHIVPPNLFQRLTCLRTLGLEGESIEKLPNEVEKLIHLRYLNLSRTNIAELPESMCNLCNLQTLKFTKCSKLEKLPQAMGKLINLRHLIFDVSAIKSFPKGIGRLSYLRTLSRIVVDSKNDVGGCELEDLKNLNHLRGSFALEGLGKVVDVREAKNAQLKKKIHLHHLELWFNRGSEGEDEKYRRMKHDALILNALEPHPGLECLSIRRYQASLMYPNWMMSLTKLKILLLSTCPKLECLPPLGKLSSLKILTIAIAQSLKKVGVEFLGIESIDKKDDDMIIIFPKLKYLEFCYLNEWEEWIGIGGMREEEEHGVTIMPLLTDLTIDSCPKLKALPNFLHTTPLKKLKILKSPMLSRRVKREDWPKLSHISNIQIDWKYVERDDSECKSNSSSDSDSTRLIDSEVISSSSSFHLEKIS
jgi:Leucine-rich repeat (LRR) protein